MQKVILNNVQGNELKINYGVPLGSVSGPTLFITYINSICDSQIDNYKCKLYYLFIVLRYNTEMCTY